MAHAPAKRKHQFRKAAKKAAAPAVDPAMEDAAQPPMAEQQGGAPMPMPQHAKGGLVTKAAKMYASVERAPKAAPDTKGASMANRMYGAKRVAKG